MTRHIDVVVGDSVAGADPSRGTGVEARSIEPSRLKTVEADPATPKCTNVCAAESTGVSVSAAC